MPNTTKGLHFKREIQAPAREVYRAMTHSVALRDWLSDSARVENRTGGRLYLVWNRGYTVTGEYVTLAPESKIVFSWQGTNEPAPTQVQVKLVEKEGVTMVDLVHRGLGSGKKWSAAREQIARGWELGLENLQSVLESGIDLRALRKPRLGIWIDYFNADTAAKMGMPVKEGVLLQGTFEGTGARASGLEKDDVLVRMGGKKVASPEDIDAVLQGKQAGDRLPVLVYRGKEKRRFAVQLSPRLVPHFPATTAELVDAVRKNVMQVRTGIQTLLDGVTEKEAEFRPAPEEWTIKELIAHFIACERDYQSWIADMINDNTVGESLENRPNVTPRLQAIVKRYPTLPELEQAFESAQDETLDFLAALPDSFVARKHMFRRAADWGTNVMGSHLTEEHGDQFRATLAAARK